MTDEKQDSEARGAMGDDLFTIGEATKYLNVAHNTIKAYALRGGLPYTVTAGGVKLFRRADLDAILPSIEKNRERWGAAGKRKVEGE